MKDTKANIYASAHKNTDVFSKHTTVDLGHPIPDQAREHTRKMLTEAFRKIWDLKTVNVRFDDEPKPYAPETPEDYYSPGHHSMEITTKSDINSLPAKFLRDLAHRVLSTTPEGNQNSDCIKLLNDLWQNPETHLNSTVATTDRDRHGGTDSQ